MPDTQIDPSLSRSLARSLAVTALFLKRQLRIWPLIAAMLLVVIGFDPDRRGVTASASSSRSAAAVGHGNRRP
jgi:peptidoglycan/LPS O-acetylase OafA/YrhL